MREDEQFRWFGLGWKVNTDLPGPASFAAATQFVTPEQVASALPCGADVREVVEKLRPFVDAGFTELALVQIGAEHQEPFIRWAEAELLPALRQETKAAARMSFADSGTSRTSARRLALCEAGAPMSSRVHVS